MARIENNYNILALILDVDDADNPLDVDQNVLKEYVDTLIENPTLYPVLRCDASNTSINDVSTIFGCTLSGISSITPPSIGLKFNAGVNEFIIGSSD